MAQANDILVGLGHKHLIPKLRDGLDLGQLQLGQRDGYVLSRIDGATNLWQVCLLVPLPREQTLGILRQLRSRGVIDIPGSTEPMPAATPVNVPRRSVATPAPPAEPIAVRRTPPPPEHLLSRTSPRPEPQGAMSAMSPDTTAVLKMHPADPRAEVEVFRPGKGTRVAEDTRPARRPSTSPPRRMTPPPAPPRRVTPAPLAEEECELPADQRERIDVLYAQLNVLDPCTLLGVSPTDDRKTVQRAYFRLSKEYHPDRFFKKRLGPYRERIGAIFQAITDARDALSDDGRRAAPPERNRE